MDVQQLTLVNQHESEDLSAMEVTFLHSNNINKYL